MTALDARAYASAMHSAPTRSALRRAQRRLQACIRVPPERLSNEHLNVPLPTDIPIFTDLLHEAGYEVAIVGKVHIHNGVEDRYWDYYFGHNNPGNNYANPFFKEGRKGKVGPEKQYHNIYPDDLTVDRALAWLEEDRGDKPFCLLVWFVAPHEPFLPGAASFRSLPRNPVIPKPANFRR